MRIRFLLAFLLSGINYCSAQVNLSEKVLQNPVNIVPMEIFLSNEAENNINRLPSYPLSMRPYIVPSSVASNHYTYNGKVDTFSHGIAKSLLQEDWIGYQYKIFSLKVNPILDLEVGKEKDNTKSLYYNTRGVQLYGNITDKIFYTTSFYENQGYFPSYMTKYIRDTMIVPSQGRVKNFHTDGSVDYEWAEGLITYKPNEYFDVTAGNGKNFYGNGYRSLLWSDNTVPYTHVKFNVHFGKFHYSLMFASMLNYDDAAVLGKGYDKKYAAVHYLDFWLGKKLEVGLFESIIWPEYDSTRYRGFDLNYLNPIIFYHSVQNYLGSPDNSLVGLNLHLKATNQIHLYGQAVIDDLDIAHSTQQGFYRNKFAIQAGGKLYEPFNIKHLFIQAEINQAQPYTYAHKLTTINYTAYQQPIADPLGANFREAIFIVNYDYKRWYGQFKTMYAQIGADTGSSHYGHNIFISDYYIPGWPKSYNNELLQGIKTSVVNMEMKAGYIINPTNRMAVQASITYRKQSSKLESDDTIFISFGILTNLFNKYYDF